MPANEFETIQKAVEAIEGIVQIKELDLYPDFPKEAQFCLVCKDGIRIQKVNIDEYSGDEYFLILPHFASTFHIVLGHLSEAARIAVALQKHWKAFVASEGLPEQELINQKWNKLRGKLRGLESF